MELGACSVQAQEDADWDECMDANDACVTDCFGYNPFTYDPNDPYNPGDGTITLPYTYDPTYTYDPDTFVSPAAPSAPPPTPPPMCNGADSGCYNIAEGDGDCDSDADCQPGLSCENNCVGAQFDASDDCCFRRSEDDRYDAPPQYGGSAADGDSRGGGAARQQCAEPRRGVLGGVRPQGRRVPGLLRHDGRVLPARLRRGRADVFARQEWMLEQSLLHRRVPVAAVGAAVAAPPPAPPRPPNMPALDFGACAAELAPEPPFVPRADPAALEGKLELGQTHVVDVRELGLLDGEECASRPTFRGPQGPDGADFGAESHVGADATFGAGGCSRVHAKLTSGRETLLLFTPAAHISEEATRVLVSATTAGGDALGTLALLPPSGRSPSSSRSSRRTTSTSTEGWASGSPRGGR